MLEIWYLVSGFFQLVLRVSLEFISDIINKGLEVSKVFLEESFKVRLCDKNGALEIVLILSLPRVNSTIKKWGCK